MNTPDPIVFKSIEDLKDRLPDFRDRLFEGQPENLSGLCGFDGFVDTFIRMKNPSSMEEFGPKVAKAAGIAASYSVAHEGDKFGGNGPLFACAFNDIHGGKIDVTYVGGVGREKVEPIFEKALKGKVGNIHTLAPPAHSDCLEFTDGKIMLGDFDACGEITLDRLLEVMGEEALDDELGRCDFISAVNWGKLPHAGGIWSGLAERLGRLGREPKRVKFFMDPAEFEHRSREDLDGLLKRLGPITERATTLLSFNLKEAWQMGDLFNRDFHGKKDPESVAELAALLFGNLDVDKLIIHPNDGAACASGEGCVYVPGPFCKEPLISTGAGDNFGAGCLAAALLGLDDTGIALAGNAASGHFVRSGRSATFKDMVQLIDAWSDGSLPERL